ncbi:hypothetical protein ACS0TY_033868 [Phlomoides rotata]
MDSTQYTVTLEEFRLFHGIDRALFLILVSDLGRLPNECLYILGLWLWLERAGFYNFISKVLRLPTILIDEVADEAMACLGCLNAQFPPPPESAEIPLTHSLVQRDISLQFFQENCLTIFLEIQNLVRGVCVPTLSDIWLNDASAFFNNSTQAPIMGTARASSSNQAWAPHPPVQRNTVSSRPQNQQMLRYEIPQNYGGRPRREMSPEERERNERTMFVTFSKGYPVSEAEIRRFFSRIFGNCIESFYMQEVRGGEQALYARIVFRSPLYIDSILEGQTRRGKVKIILNGKHVWMRKFVATQPGGPRHY